MKKAIVVLAALVIAAVTLHLVNGDPSREADQESTASKKSAAPREAKTASPQLVPGASPSPAPITEPTAPTPSSPSQAVPSDRDDGDWRPVPPDAEKVPADSASAAAHAQARRAAIAAVKAFARPAPAADPGQWGPRLSRLVAARYADDFAVIDPLRVPYRRVTGPAVVVPVDAPADVLTRVRVPTDAGPYAVDLEVDDRGRWVTAIYPWSER
jgi:hypothetical protein